MQGFILFYFISWIGSQSAYLSKAREDNGLVDAEVATRESGRRVRETEAILEIRSL
jgi:hypothetical protein